MTIGWIAGSTASGCRGRSSGGGRPAEGRGARRVLPAVMFGAVALGGVVVAERGVQGRRLSDVGFRCAPDLAAETDP